MATGVADRGRRPLLVRRAVIADVSAPALYGRLLDSSAVPAGVRADLEKFEWDTPVVKVNYALDREDSVAVAEPRICRNRASGRRRQRTGPVDGRPDHRRDPDPPVPAVRSDDDVRSQPFARGNRKRLGLHASAAGNHGRRVGRVAGRTGWTRCSSRTRRDSPSGWSGESSSVRRTSRRANANLHGGAVNGGTAQLYQQLVFRPTPGSSGP